MRSTLSKLWRVVVAAFACALASSGLPNAIERAKAAQVAGPAPIPIERNVGEETSPGDVLRYAGYFLRKRHRTVRFDDAVESGGRPLFADNEYAVLIRGGRTLRRFDGRNYSPMGNVLTFGVFPFLGRTRKQFFISQDIFRGGNQWVVEVQPAPRIIYDGDEWLTGREVDDLSVIDLDGDGVYEISVPTCIFYGFANLSPAATPLSTIIFKYSKTAQKYLPANPRFRNRLLADIKERERQISSPTNPVEEMNHLGRVMAILLDYVFAGRRHEGWIFYDRAYKLPDKQEVKREILVKLRKSPVYQFIYRRYAHRKVRGLKTAEATRQSSFEIESCPCPS